MTDAEREAYIATLKEKMTSERKAKARAWSRKWEAANRVKRNKEASLRRALDPSKRRLASRKHWYKSKFGITLKERDDLFTFQNKRCAICRLDETPRQRWHVDHCHTSGTIRGILCGNCNLLLGNAKDKIHVLYAAIKYLEDYNGRERREEKSSYTQNPNPDAPQRDWLQCSS